MSSQGETAISVKSVTKHFILPHQKASTLKSFFVNPFTKYENEKQLALDDVSFDVKKGEFFGIVGRNGSGKSTLLKCMAGVYSPDKGDIKVNGSLVPFIELGVGFNPELSGRDNVYLNGALLGFSRPEVDSMYDKIVEFSELEKFMDQKLKNYSSGMQVRLAFSIAIQAKSGILLFDEVLAVGDAIFQQKCFEYFDSIKSAGKTIVLVSHDANALRRFCGRGILIEEGKKICEGPIDVVLDDYADLIREERTAGLRAKGILGGSAQEKISLKEVVLSNRANEQKDTFGDSDEEIKISMKCVAKAALETPVYGISIKDNLGTAIFTSNNIRREKKSFNLEAGDEQEIIWNIPNIFNVGKLYLSVAVTDKNGKRIHLRRDNYKTFNISRKLTSTALTNPAHSLEVLPVKKASKRKA